MCGGCAAAPERVQAECVAAVCTLCVRAEREGGLGTGAVRCTVDGLPMRGRRACPRGVFGEGKRVRALGVETIGVPRWVRWVWRWWPGVRVPMGAWGGCGCVRAWKAAAVGMRRWARGRWRDAVSGLACCGGPDPVIGQKTRT